MDRVFKASDHLAVEVKTEMKRPYLVIKDTLEEHGGDPLWVTVYPNEVKKLIEALTDAAVALVDQVQEHSQSLRLSS